MLFGERTRMRVVKINDIKNELVSNMRRNSLIPVIGSGFTRGCKSTCGEVPSGRDYKIYMVKEIVKALSLSESEEKDLLKDSFSNVSSIYHRTVPFHDRISYLKANFTNVDLESEKRDFLTLNWPYIYTLNIDDGIERCSEYSHVIYANRDVNDNIFDSNKCVIKLHGDINEMLTYNDSHSEVFTQEQYVASLRDNKSLLTKLKQDALFQNLIYVGCSLDDEIDLLAYSLPESNTTVRTSKYLCAISTPSTIEQLKFEKYGITHCILFESYDSIYNELFQIGLESEKISVDDLVAFRSMSINLLPSTYEKNQPYLFFGKSLIEKNTSSRAISLPYYFISRTITGTVISNFNYYNIQVLVGSGCSGRSYIMADIVYRIRDKDIFLFETKDRLNDAAFNSLLNREDCILLFDSNSLTPSQIQQLLLSKKTLSNNRIFVVIFAGKKDRDLSGILKLYEIQGKLSENDYYIASINNKLSKDELDQLNPLLTAINVGVFNEKKTIVDNIIICGYKLRIKTKYNNYNPQLRTALDVAALIALATEKKIYANRAVELDILDQIRDQNLKLAPLVDSEVTWSYEKSTGDNSPLKYVLNAEYWLYEYLGQFANNEKNHEIIIDAYKHLIQRIIEQEGPLDLMSPAREASYKNYILFDNINLIFRSGSRNGSVLIRVIYESLNDYLSVDPNYMHQRAKCYIKSAQYETDSSIKEDFLDKAFRDAVVAFRIFETRYERSKNEKLLISIAHVMYTQALIMCYKCSNNSFNNLSDNSMATKTLYDALNSPYNSYEFVKRDAFNYQNIIAKTIQTFIADKTLVEEEYWHYLEDLFHIIS